jgi:hypothetical protein
MAMTFGTSMLFYCLDIPACVRVRVYARAYACALGVLKEKLWNTLRDTHLPARARMHTERERGGGR